MSGQIKVDFGSLAELQSQVNSTAQKILTEIEDIKRTVERHPGVLERCRPGPVRRRYAQLETAQKNVQEAINQFGGLIGRANQAYGDAESKIKGMFA